MKKIDITMQVTPSMLEDAKQLKRKELEGHLGTHFDVMAETFPLEYTERCGVIFDVSEVGERDIDISDVDLGRVGEGAFVLFRTGFSASEEYGTRRYFGEHPQLSAALIDALLEKKISVIGIDFAGVRRGEEHIPTDSRCAERGVFIIENLVDLDLLPCDGTPFTVHTYPMNILGVTGLPCRVVAEIGAEQPLRAFPLVLL